MMVRSNSCSCVDCMCVVTCTVMTTYCNDCRMLIELLAPVVRRVVQAGHDRAVLLVVHRRLVVGIDWRVAEQAIGVPLIHLLRGIQLRKGAYGGKHLDLGRELSRSGFRWKIEGGRKGESRERGSVERGWETESSSECGRE